MSSVISVKKENLNKLGYRDLENWLENPNHLYIGRDMSFYVKGANKSKWCNPYNVKKFGLEKCLELYTEYVKESGLIDQIGELEGKVLGCWCRVDDRPETVCHGDILVKLLSGR